MNNEEILTKRNKKLKRMRFCRTSRQNTLPT